MKKKLIFCIVFSFYLGFFSFVFSCDDSGDNTADEAPKSVPMTNPQQIFDYLKGKKAVTNGWADLANNGDGMAYANPQNLTLIDDSFLTPKEKREAFTGAIDNNNPKFVIVSGDIDLSDGRISDDDKSYFDQFGPAPQYRRTNGDIVFNIGSNTTIIGINARLMFGALIIKNGSNNIIIRNITFWDAHGSTAQNTAFFPDSKASATSLQIDNAPGGSAIWIDHCKFTDGLCSDLIRNYNHDGSFDIKYGSFITVSWNEFTNHDKVMLVGSSDETRPDRLNYLDPAERQITLHHNYFHGVTQRMPRTRGAQIHIYNNYYNNIGVLGNNGYAMGPGINAQFIVENNYFGNIRDSNGGVKGRIVDWYDNDNYPAVLCAPHGNSARGEILDYIMPSYYDRTWGLKPWEPAYSYNLKPANNLPELISANAGPVMKSIY